MKIKYYVTFRYFGGFGSGFFMTSEEKLTEKVITDIKEELEEANGIESIVVDNIIKLDE